MSVLTRKPWLKHLAVVLVTVLSLGSLTLTSTPAQARVFVGVGIPGWDYYAPTPYYGYGYYGYPAYGYRYGYPGGFFIGGTFGPHHHYYPHWR
jgi:hypothetical protein